MTSDRESPAALSSRTIIGVAVLVAAALRIVWAIRHDFVLEQEGVEYARIGQNLLAGRGYVGMFANGTQLNFPPLFPVAIAGVSLLTRDADIAARCICIVLGALLVIPMFKIAERLYGQRVAIAVAALVVFHPVLIAGSASTYAEGPYLTLLMCAVLWVLNWVDHRRLSASLWAGGFFGLAYLVRPEAFVTVGAFVGAGLAIAVVMRERRAMMLGVAGLAGSFLMVAAPNIAFLTISTGKLRIEAKGTLAYQWGSRIDAGMSYQEAVNGIGEDLSDQGVFMQPNINMINAPPPSPKQYARFLLDAARRNVSPIHQTIVDEPAFGSPFLFVLVILGLLRVPWTRTRLGYEAILLTSAALVVLVLLTVQELWFRYFYALLAFFLIWGGKGADDLCDWVRDSVTSVTGQSRFRGSMGGVIKWGAISAVLLFSLRAMPGVAQFRESLFKERAVAGRWLASQQPEHKLVMDVGLQVPFYAGADLRYLPYASSDLALRYVAKHRPDFIVLHSDAMNSQPYTAAWFKSGIPDKRAELVYDKPGALDTIRIYRWVDSSR